MYNHQQHSSGQRAPYGQPPGMMAVPGAYQGPGGLTTNPPGGLTTNPPGGVHMFNPAQQPGMIPGGQKPAPLQSHPIHGIHGITAPMNQLSLNQTTTPPNTMMGPPPNTMTGPPPNTMTGPPPNSMMGPPPNTMMGLPPNSMTGPPPNSMTGPPPNTMMGPPPNSMTGPPPNSMTGPPPNSMTGPPPNSMTGPPPNTMMGPPPNSLARPEAQNPPGTIQSTSIHGAPIMSAGPLNRGMQGMVPPGMGTQGMVPPGMGTQGMVPPGMGTQGMVPPGMGTQGMVPPGMGTQGMVPPGMGTQGMVPPGMGTQGMVPLGMGTQGMVPPGMGTQGMVPPVTNVGGPPGAPPGPPGSQPVGGPLGGLQPPGPPAPKMDPENMPNPVSVISADQRDNAGKEYLTSSIGQAPPLVTTPFKVVDNGVCSPRFLRSTLYSFPATSGLANECKIPMALMIQPLADIEEGELEPPLVDHGPKGPIRCKRCKAYMNPFNRFIDGGRQYLCTFCQCNNEVPGEYFSYLDHSGRRTDAGQRPELCYGSCEFLATEDYCKKNRLPSTPAYLVMIDVSAGPLQNGMVNLLCQNITRILGSLPRSGEGKCEVKIGFAAYDTAIYFFNLKSSLGVPQMMVVSDLEDVFVPLVDGILVSPEEAMQCIESLFTQLPGMFIGCKKPQSVLGPALKGGLEALRSGDCNGKLLVFHHGLPSGGGPGQLKDRLDQKLLGTDKEKNLLNPHSNFYSKLAEECVDAGVGIDLFMSTTSYSDLATIGHCIATTGGELHYYPMFKASVDGEKLIKDVTHTLQRPAAFDCVMRVRASTGIRPVEYYGGFYKNNPTDMEFGSIDSEKAVSVEIKHDEKLKEGELVYFQVALLYTSIYGQRRLRIHNLQLTTTARHIDVYRGCDQDTILNFMLKKAVRDSLSSPYKSVSANLTTLCVKILTTYRKHCSQNSAPGQLILPESLKLLPIYANCILKSQAVCSPPLLSIDHKSAMMWLVMTLGPVRTLPLLYPHLYQLHDLHPEGTDAPPMMRCSGKKVSEDGVYLVENGVSMVIWVGSRVSNEFVSRVFGVGSQAQIDPEGSVLPVLENSLSVRIRNVIDRLHKERKTHMKLRFAKQRDKSELKFRMYLREDVGPGETLSYIDYLCHIHREIKQGLS